MSKILFLATILISLFIACDSQTESEIVLKDQTILVDTTGQKPMLQFSKLDSTKLSLNTAINSSSYEFGPRLKFLKDGSITGFGILMPDSGQYRITLWNLADTSIVKTDSIVVDSGKIKYKNITSIQVKANDDYSITIQSNDWYWYTDINNKANFFPKTIKDIIIINYGYRSGQEQKFPDTQFTNYLAGLQDIIFKTK